MTLIQIIFIYKVTIKLYTKSNLYFFLIFTRITITITDFANVIQNY